MGMATLVFNLSIFPGNGGNGDAWLIATASPWRATERRAEPRHLPTCSAGELQVFLVSHPNPASVREISTRGLSLLLPYPVEPGELATVGGRGSTKRPPVKFHHRGLPSNSTVADDSTSPRPASQAAAAGPGWSRRCRCKRVSRRGSPTCGHQSVDKVVTLHGSLLSLRLLCVSQQHQRATGGCLPMSTRR